MAVGFVLQVQRPAPSSPGTARRKPAEFLASYSYSLYLVHNTVLVLVAHFMTSGSGLP